MSYNYLKKYKIVFGDSFISNLKIKRLKMVHFKNLETK